jgi:hypothetical protein
MSEACKRFGGRRRPAAPLSPQSLTQNVRLCTRINGNLNGWRYEGPFRAHPTTWIMIPGLPFTPEAWIGLLFVRLRFSAAVRCALWNGARKLERNGKAPVAKNTMQPETHADSITGATRGHAARWYQLVHVDFYVLFIPPCAGATLKRGKGAAFIG